MYKEPFCLIYSFKSQFELLIYKDTNCSLKFQNYIVIYTHVLYKIYMHVHITARSCNFTFSRLKFWLLKKNVWIMWYTILSSCSDIYYVWIYGKRDKLVMVWCQSVISLEVVRIFLRQRREHVSIMQVPLLKFHYGRNFGGGIAWWTWWITCRRRFLSVAPGLLIAARYHVIYLDRC